jgi:hypothetical protein
MLRRRHASGEGAVGAAGGRGVTGAMGQGQRGERLSAVTAEARGRTTGCEEASDVVDGRGLGGLCSGGGSCRRGEEGTRLQRCEHGVAGGLEVNGGVLNQEQCAPRAGETRSMLLSCTPCLSCGTSSSCRDAAFFLQLWRRPALARCVPAATKIFNFFLLALALHDFDEVPDSFYLAHPPKIGTLQ